MQMQMQVPEWADYSRPSTAAEWCGCAVLCLRSGRYGESGKMNQSVFGGQGGERPVRVSPGATRAFSSLCVSVQSSFSCFPTAPFVSLFAPSAKHSPGPGPVPGQGLFVWVSGIDLSPSWSFFSFFLVAIVTAAIPAARACCTSSSALLSASRCVLSAFALISAVISGLGPIVQCAQCYQLPATGGTARQSWVLPLSRLVP